jgi:hypothetical protein
MTRFASRLLSGMLLAVLLAGSHARGQDAPPADGVEPQARGPIHEAYAAPADGQAAPGRVIDRQPPEPIEEIPAEQKPAGDNVQWISGYWAWDDARSDFLWVSGFWRVPPPGRTWVPGSWRKVDGGFQWVSGIWTPTAQPDLQYLPPPPVSIETGPTVPAPSPDHIYVPGGWVYSGYRYAWRPGCWVVHRPGWVWIPATYRWSPAGYVYVDGYWDYPLAARGIIFAPVFVDRRYCYRPGWYYAPRYVVYEPALYGAMFVRPGVGCYFYGDYFEARYTTLGYRSWFSVSFSVGYRYDPLFSYYSVTYRSDPYWAPGIREVYVARYAGDLPRPPVTIVNNNTTIVNNTIVNNTVINNKYTNINKSTNLTNVTNVNNNVVHVNNYNQVVTNNTTNNTTTNVMKLQPVAAAQRQTFAQQSKDLQVAAKERVTHETHLSAQGPVKVGDAPKVAKLNLPASTATSAHNLSPAHQPPAPPVAPHQPSHPTINPPKTGGNSPQNINAPKTGGAPMPPISPLPPLTGPPKSGGTPIPPISPMPPVTGPPKTGGSPMPPLINPPRPGPMPPKPPMGGSSGDKDKDKKKDKDK